MSIHQTRTIATSEPHVPVRAGRAAETTFLENAPPSSCQVSVSESGRSAPARPNGQAATPTGGAHPRESSRQQEPHSSRRPDGIKERHHGAGATAPPRVSQPEPLTGRRDRLGKEEEMDEGTEAVHTGDRKPAANPARHRKKVAAPGTEGSDSKAMDGATKLEPTYVPEIILGELPAHPSPDERARRERTREVPKLVPASIGDNPSPDERAKQERVSAGLAAAAKRAGMDDEGTDSDSKMPSQQGLKSAAVPELAATEGGVHPSPDERARMGIYARVGGAQTSRMMHNDTGLGRPATSPSSNGGSDVRDFHTTLEDVDLDAAGIGIVDVSVRPGAVAVGGSTSGNELGSNAGIAAPAEEEETGRGLMTSLSGFVVQPRRRRAPLTVDQLLANAPLVDGVAIPEREEQEEGNFFRRHRKAIAISALLMVIGGGVAGAVTVICRDQAKKNGADQVQPTVQGCGASPRPAEEQSLRELFCKALPSACPSLSNTFSSQCAALRWLASDPSLSSYDERQKRQRYALATFYESTFGLENSSTWMDYSLNECIWDGITCNSQGVNVLNFGDWKKDIETGDRVDKQPLILGGSLPKELSLLSSVEYIYLSGCGLMHTIPTEIGMISSLHNFWLTENEIVGPIPSEMGNLINLKQLYLDGNALTGTIPSEMSQMSGLRELDLSSSTLTGTIPTEMAQMSNLQWLWLDDNALMGTVPEALCALADNAQLDTFIVADCLGDPPEVVCACCEVCCNKTMCCWDDGFCHSF